MRDYIHVVDLGLGHLKALQWLDSSNGFGIFNLGRGRGVSVLELVNAFQAATGVHIPYTFAPRRAGDVDMCFADATLAERELKWRAERDIEAMCRDSWNWQINNPNGY